IRVIQEHAAGNTLATVFAVAEAERESDFGAFVATLFNRRLADGLQAYYSSIWNHMLESAGENSRGIDACISGAVSLGQRSLKSEFFADAFRAWNKPAAWWRMVLESLGPLLTQSDDGFRVRHNDNRIFLSARFAAFPEIERSRVLSNLADHYLCRDSDRL